MAGELPGDEIEVVPANLAGRIGSIALAFGAAGNAITLLSQKIDPVRLIVGAGVSVATLLVAAAAYFIRWETKSPRATLWLVPPAVTVLAIGNYTDPLPFVAGIYFVLLGAWIGLSQPRWTALRLSPLFVISFALPLLHAPGSDRLIESTIIITVVSVAIGEVLATMRARLERSLAELSASAERRFAMLATNSADVTFVLGNAGTVRYVSPAITARFGYEASDLEALDADELLAQMVRGLSMELRESVRSEIATLGRVIDDLEFQFRHADGTWVDVEATVQNMNHDPEIKGVVVHVRDVRQKRALQRDLVHRAFHDDLTGLANRASLRREVSRSKDMGERISLVFIDLDGFKAVNDTAGHQQGDRLLKAMAKRLIDAAPEGSLVARLGGDEFAVILRCGIGEAESVAEIFVETISVPLEIDGTVMAVGASAGVAEADGDSSLGQVIEDADMAMYAAKNADRNRVVRYDAAMRTRLRERVDARLRLAQAVEADEFILHYQPELNLRSGEWTGAEALVRWDRPEGGGLVSPGEFIDLAEESGLIVDIGRRILFAACAEATRWTSSGSGAPWVAVNVSARQFQDRGFMADVGSALDESGLPPERLVVELTESILVADAATAARRMGALRDIGVRLALDDFGTGYASLSYLQRLPFDILKIDRSFLHNVTTDFGAYSILQTINRLGHDLGLSTLVEGVETEEQLMLAIRLGCDLAQGYHIARPMEPERFREQLLLPRIGPVTPVA